MADVVSRLVKSGLAVVRLASVGLLLLGGVILKSGFSSQGLEPISLFIGGICALIGIVGIFKPRAVVPSGGHAN